MNKCVLAYKRAKAIAKAQIQALKVPGTPIRGTIPANDIGDGQVFLCDNETRTVTVLKPAVTEEEAQYWLNRASEIDNVPSV